MTGASICAPVEFVAAATAALHAPGATAPALPRYCTLIGRRQLRANNSWLHNIASMTGGSNRCSVLMHPDDAQARGLADGDVVRVASAVGEIEVPVDVTADIRAGTVAVPHGWGHRGTGWRHAESLAGANVNALHDPDLVDAFTGTAAVNGTWVSVRATDQFENS